MTTKIISLAAVLLADGSIDIKRNTVSFTEDEELVARFIKEFHEIDGIEIKWKTNPHRNSLRARAYNKKLVHLLLEKSPTYRTRSWRVHPTSKTKHKSGGPKPTIPLECFQNREEARNFLRYYTSCDGGPQFSIYKRKNGYIQLDMGIKIGCKNSFLRKQLLRLLEIFSIQAEEKENGILIKSSRSILKFAKEIGFLEESKIRKSKRFNGFKKNDLIKLMLICSELTKRGNWINKNFKTISDLEKFLITLLNYIKTSQISQLNQFLTKRLGPKFQIDSLYLAEIGPVTSGEGVPVVLYPKPAIKQSDGEGTAGRSDQGEATV